MQLYDHDLSAYEGNANLSPFRWGPGKSAPRLVQDLANHVIGSETLISFPEGLTLQHGTNDYRKHAWIIDLGYEQDWDETSKVIRACCEYTRIHVELHVEYHGDAILAQHCLNRDRLHHFQLLTEDNVQSTTYDAFTWCCSCCATHLNVKLWKPEVSQATLDAVLTIRPLSTYSKPSQTSGEVGPSRFSTFMAIEYYLRNTAKFNAERQDSGPREIEYRKGSLFERLVGLEPEIIALMKECMFRLAPGDWDRSSWYDERDVHDEMNEDGIEWAFFPADPRSAGVRGRYSRLRLELQILAWEAKSSVGDPHRNRNWLVKQVRAESYMLKLMDAEERLYLERKHGVLDASNDSTLQDVCYAKLGCITTFTDQMLIDFFKLQIEHDQNSLSYYLSALQLIGKARRSDSILTEIQRQKSMGAYCREDVIDAYNVLGEDSENDDETLINIAASVMLDDQLLKHKARNALEILGRERDSAVIRKYLDTPEKDFNDIDSALEYLGADNDTDDDFLMILYDMKQEMNSSLARSALETIADERKNTRLRRFLDTGERDAVPSVKFDLTNAVDTDILDPDLAYSRLGVDDRNIDDDMLIMLYEIRSADEPDEEAALKKALGVIGENRESATIKNFLNTGSKEPIEHYRPPPASMERPTGIENIGNTCYLNSLLQYYFTIRLLRETILDMDAHIETEITTDVLQRKKVGGRRVTREEIERALRFMIELRQLFRSLITSEASSLRPSKTLCFLALVSQKDESNSLISSKPNTLEKGSGLTLVGDESNQLILSKSPASEEIDDEVMLESSADSLSLPLAEMLTDQSPKRKASRVPTVGLKASSSNLENSSGGQMDSFTSSDPSIQKYEDDLHTIEGSTHSSETLQETESTNKKPKIVDKDLLVSVEDSHKVDRRGPAASDIGDDLIDAPTAHSSRRKSSVRWSDSHDWGKQQDVAECVDNCLFQLEAALSPSSAIVAEDGEQIDLIKDLFYGTTVQKLDVKDNVAKSERFSNTIVTLEKEGQDLYQALDGVFDERHVELDGKQVKLNLTISRAPPILQIQIQRAAFDIKTMSAVKSNTYIALDQSIYLDRYMDLDEPEMLQSRERYWQWKRELAIASQTREELENQLRSAEVFGPENSDHIWSATANEVDSDSDEADNDGKHVEYAEDVPMTDIRRGSVRMIKEESMSSTSKQENEIALRACEAQEKDYSYKLAHLFDRHVSHEYRLHSVFIHRGEATHGHYWVYIYDFQLDKWRKYNDEEVTDVSRAEVFKDRRGMNENPYMVTYVRASELTLTSALEREFGRSWEDQSLI